MGLTASNQCISFNAHDMAVDNCSDHVLLGLGDTRLSPSLDLDHFDRSHYNRNRSLHWIQTAIVLCGQLHRPVVTKRIVHAIFINRSAFGSHPRRWRSQLFQLLVFAKRQWLRMLRIESRDPAPRPGESNRDLAVPLHHVHSRCFRVSSLVDLTLTLPLRTTPTFVFTIPVSILFRRTGRYNGLRWLRAARTRRTLTAS